MGEPIPGDIPDPLWIQSAKVKLKKDQKGNRGDYITFAGSGLWQKIPTTTAGVVKGAWMQTPEDFDTTGLADGDATITGYGPGSRIYAFSTRDGIIPNGRCQLEVFGGRVGFTSNVNVAITGVSVASNIISVTTAAGAQLEVGDVATISGLTGNGAHLNGSYRVSTRTNSIWTAETPAVNQTGIVVTNSTSGYQITAGNANAQYIKRSGDTEATEIGTGEIGVFNIAQGGNPI